MMDEYTSLELERYQERYPKTLEIVDDIVQGYIRKNRDQLALRMLTPPAIGDATGNELRDLITTHILEADSGDLPIMPVKQLAALIAETTTENAKAFVDAAVSEIKQENEKLFDDMLYEVFYRELPWLLEKPDYYDGRQSCFVDVKPYGDNWLFNQN